jgi:hypothetical protein
MSQPGGLIVYQSSKAHRQDKGFQGRKSADCYLLQRE